MSLYPLDGTYRWKKYPSQLSGRKQVQYTTITLWSLIQETEISRKEELTACLAHGEKTKQQRGGQSTASYTAGSLLQINLS